MINNLQKFHIYNKTKVTTKINDKYTVKYDVIFDAIIHRNT